MKNEVKVGIFIFLGILSLIFLTLRVNDLRDFNKKGYILYAYIGDASGLAKKAKVKLRGVTVGNVEQMSLEANHVKLSLLINKNVKIPVGSTVTLAQDNFLGGKYVKIIPPSNNIFSYYLPKQTIKKYITNVSLDDVMANLNTAITEVNLLIKKMNTTLNEQTIRNIQDTISNVKYSSDSLKSLMVKLDKKIPQILDNTNSLIQIYKKAGVSLNKKLPSILNKTDTLLAKFNKTGDVINSKLSKLMNEYIKVGENANDILTNNKQGIKQAVSSAKDFFVSGGESFKKIDDFLSSLTKSQILVDIQSNYMINDGYFKTYAQIAYLPVPTKYYILGVTSSRDYSDLATATLPHQDNKIYISAEYGKRFDNLLLRGGIIENTGGLGLDYYLDNDKLKLSGDVYDFNAVNDVRGENPHLTLKGTYLYLKHIEFIGGVDNILNTDARTFFLGVGVKFKDNDLKTILSGGASSFLK